MRKRIFINKAIDILNIFIILGFIPIYYKSNWLNIGMVQKLNFSLISVVFFFLFLKGCITRKLLSKNRFIINKSIILFLLIIFVISLISTNSHGEFIVNYIKLVYTAVYAIYLVEYYKIEKLTCILLNVHLIVLILNILFYYLNPQLSFDLLDNTSAVSALFTQKNQFGTELAFGILISFNCVINKNINKLYRLLAIISIIVSVIMLNLVQSVTSILSIIVPIVLFYLFLLRKGKMSVIRILLAVNLVVILIVFYGDFFSDIFIKIFNRDITLTGRLDIWKAILTTVGIRVLFGFGYFTFWGFNPYYESKIKGLTFETLGSAHNTFFEVILNVGVIGMVIFILYLLNVDKKIRQAKYYNNYETALVVIYFSYICIFFITERTLWPLHYQTMMIFLCTSLINKNVYKESSENNNSIYIRR